MPTNWMSKSVSEIGKMLWGSMWNPAGNDSDADNEAAMMRILAAPAGTAQRIDTTQLTDEQCRNILDAMLLSRELGFRDGRISQQSAITRLRALLHNAEMALERQAAQIERLRIGIKLSFGRRENIPWTELPDSLIESLLQDVDALAERKEPKL